MDASVSNTDAIPAPRNVDCHIDGDSTVNDTNSEDVSEKATFLEIT